MNKVLKIILVSLILLVIVVLTLYFTGVLRGYYYDTNIVIGEHKVYSYNEITISKVKCMNSFLFYEDDDYRYFVNKPGCKKEVYYLKVDGKYITLEDAFEKGMINQQEILNSKINIVRDEK